MENRDALAKALIKHIFWTQTDDYDTRKFETPENIEIVNRIINIACQQLPPVKQLRPNALYQRCVQNLRLPDAWYFYSNWC